MRVTSIALSIVLLALVPLVLTEDPTCVNLLKKVSIFDATLGSRLSTKQDVAKLSMSAADFADDMNSRDISENGRAPQSDSTRSWVGELYEGLGPQRSELRGSISQYTAKVGQELYDYIFANKDLDERQIYHIQHQGIWNHEFIIEQLPVQEGYRIYQSYTDAYDLYAWLGASADNLVANGHVSAFDSSRTKFDEWLKTLTNNVASLSNLRDLPTDKSAYLPLAKFVRDYTTKDAVTNFKASWNLYGKSAVITQTDFFANDGYLQKTKTLSADLKDKDGTNTPYTQATWDLWLQLYGAPDLLHYPGLTSNQMNTLTINKPYNLMIRVVSLTSPNENGIASNCQDRAAILTSQATSCLNQVKQLAQFDSLLSYRTEAKWETAKASADASMFATSMSDSSWRADGHEYACGLTRSWVSEVFAGLPFQYTEYKGTDPAWVGYKDVIGADVRALFTKYKSVNSHLIYQMKHVGTQDHDFIVEQLPGGLGYRVYQSYHQAYSLSSWLTPLQSDFSDLVTSGDIMVFTQVQEQANAMVSAMTNGAVTLQNLDALPSNMTSMKPFLVFVRDYDIQDAQDTLEASWSLFGKGQVIDETKFFQTNGYLSITAALTQQLKFNDMSANIFSQNMWNNWNKLYGSPNPLYFYDLPFNAIAGNMFTHGEKYSFQIKVVDLGGNERKISTQCRMNSQILSNTLPSNNVCFPEIKRLAEFDGLLSTRKATKEAAASKASNVNQFVQAMSALSVFEFGPYNDYYSHSTSSWVREVFVGLTGQYAEAKLTEAAPAEYIGTAITDYFNQYRGSKQRLIYQLKHEGTQYFEGIVEQLPDDGGYRIYQNYHDGYNLKAWLAGSVDELESMVQSNDILIFYVLKDLTDKSIKSLTQNKVSLDNLGDLPTDLKGMLPLWEYIRDYTVKDAFQNLLKAWGNYGMNMIIPSDVFFIDYLAKTVRITQEFKDKDLSDSPYTQELTDLFIELYGSPNPFYFIGLPFKTIPSTYLPGKTYSFTIKRISLGVDSNVVDSNCKKNADIIAKAAQEFTCAKGVDLLSNFDATISPRQQSKQLVAQLYSNAQQFTQIVMGSKLQMNCNQFSSASSVSWVIEVIAGLQREYATFQLTSGDRFSAVGDNLIKYFNQKKEEIGHFLHVLKHSGTSNHELIVEQLPMKAGYKIYQSYTDAYSLKAWLGVTGTQQLLLNGEIVVLPNGKKNLDATLRLLTNNQVSLANLDDLSGQLSTTYKAFAEYIRDYSADQASQFFQQAQQDYGRSKILTQAEFSDYLTKTSTLSTYLSNNNGKTNVFSNEMWSLWNTLYGSPDLLHFYSLPNNALTGMLPAGTHYQFTVQTIDLGLDEKQIDQSCVAPTKHLLDRVDQCFSAVKQLLTFDSVLSSRFQRKMAVAKISRDAETFAQNLVSSTERENGHEFACGLTRSYVSEVFVGLEAQYQEYAGTETSPIGYTEYIGDDLLKLFKDNAGKDRHIIYQLKHIGTQDHDYLIQQLPFSVGYRVYQSYHQAYSLLAWLSDTTDPMMRHWLQESGNLMVFDQVKQSADALLSKMTDGKVSLNNLGDLPNTATFTALKPFLTYVRDYNFDTVYANFIASASKYGQGQILDPRFFFNDYLAKTAALTSYLKTNDMSQNLFDQAQWDAWNSLYGSPDPLYYPGLPFTTLAEGMFPAGTRYSFQVKVVDLGGNTGQIFQDCRANSDIILNAVPIDRTCERNIQRLAESDSQLSTRLSTKIKAAKEQKDPKKFVRQLQQSGIMETGKGGSYKSASTASWVSEVFIGLTSDFGGLAGKDRASISAKEQIGLDFCHTFMVNRNNANGVIYQWQHIGAFNHEFVIEQLPNMRGYKIYQSYTDSYSLFAWLAKSDEELWDYGDLRILEDLHTQVDKILASKFGKKVSLKTLDNLPVANQALKPYLTFLRDYNKAAVEQNFGKASRQFGQTQIIPYEEFLANYVMKTTMLSTYLQSVDQTNTPFNQYYWDLWVELYGSPNTQYFPGVAANLISGSFFEQKVDYSLKVKVIELGAIGNCQANADVLYRALTGEALNAALDDESVTSSSTSIKTGSAVNSETDSGSLVKVMLIISFLLVQ